MLLKFKNLIDISQKIGSHPEYVQGGGGNVSAKLSTNEMAVKASGFRLSDLSPDRGFVVVDHAKIKGFYRLKKGIEDAAQLNIEHDKFLIDSILRQLPHQNSRPSMETGFHSFGAEYVLHTHSVYANILNCSEEGRDMIADMFEGAISVAYTAPGPSLTVGILNITEGVYPPIIFLENHGIIIGGETAGEAYDVHESTNNMIKEKLGIVAPYPMVNIKKLGENTFISTSPYIKQSIKNNRETVQGFNTTILFPDQIIYGESVGFEKDARIAIDLDQGSVTYSTNYNEALAFEETFISWLFIIEHIKRLGMTLKTISKEEGNFVTNMDSEKYRKSIIA